MSSRFLHTPLVLTLLGSAVLLPVFVSPIALAAQTEVHHYDLPAGTLEDSLNHLAQVAGLTLSFDPTQVQGKRAPALQGQYRPQDALRLLLSGSGLAATSDAQGNWLLYSADASGTAMKLGATTISSQILGSTTEGTGSYTTGHASTATKLALSARETPQSTSVITRQRIEDQGMTTLNDVIKNTPGLTLTQWGGERPRFNSRAFSVENLMYDGVPIGYEEAALSTGSLAMYDRVEIVRGAAGLMEGAGLPSGSINLVRKRPTVDPQVSVIGGLGSWDNRLFEVDASSALNEQGSLRGRSVLSYQNKNSFTDDYSNERTLLYGIVEADLTPDTTISFGVSYSNENNPGADWNGLGTYSGGHFLPVSRSTRMSPDWSYWNKESTTIFTDIEHRFDNGWKAKGAATWISSEMNMRGTFINSSTVNTSGTPTMTMRGGIYDYERDQYSYDGYLSGPFQLAGRSHSLVLGASHRVSKWDSIGGPYKNYAGYDAGAFDIATFDPTNWDPGSVSYPAVLEYGAVRSEQRIEQSSAYTTARLSLTDPLTFIIGARLDWYALDKVQYDGDYPYGEVNLKAYRELTPYLGAVYELSDNYSIYASATRIFQPQSEQSISGSVLKPIEGTNYEVGLKGEHFDGRLNSSVALFQIDLENLPEAISAAAGACRDPFATCYASAGKIRSRGVEVELSGALSENWQISAGYTYNTAERIKASDYAPIGTYTQGKRYGTNLPANLFKLATSYRLPGDMQHWKIGASVRTQSQIYSPYGVKQGGYTLVDSFVSYDVNGHLQVNLNLNNLFDKRYYSSISESIGGNFFGEPRNFMVTARYKLF